jgi:hypothetical protein
MISNIIEKVTRFNYLVCEMSYKYARDLDIDSHRFLYMCGIYK